MLRSAKRPISKTTSGSPELPITRTESAFALTCYRCGRDAEGREIEIELPASLGQRNVVWTRVPDGWWVQGTTILKLTAGCPGCMETPLDVFIPRKPEAKCEDCGHPITLGFPCDVCGPVDNNFPGKHD